MALQSSGAISLSQIANEFGLPSSKRLGAYRVSETYGALTNIPLDTGVPQSGAIKFSDFYNKKLNVIVDCYSSGGTSVSPYSWRSSDALNTGTKRVYFKIDDVGNVSPTSLYASPTMYLYPLGSPGEATVTISFKLNDSSGSGFSFKACRIDQSGGRPPIYIYGSAGRLSDPSRPTSINPDGIDSYQTDFDVVIGDEPLRVTFYDPDNPTGLFNSGLTRAIRMRKNEGSPLDVYSHNASSFYDISTTSGTSIPVLAPAMGVGIGLRDESGDDIHASFVIKNVVQSSSITRTSDTNLFPRNPTYKSLASTNTQTGSDAEFVSAFGVNMINVFDQEVNNEDRDGAYTWRYQSISIPRDGNYKIRCVADDLAALVLFSNGYAFSAGFGASAFQATRFFSAGTYSVTVQLQQQAGSAIRDGNNIYFAMSIDSTDSIIPGAPVSYLEKVGAKNRFVNNFVYMVGGFRGKPSSTSTHKVIIHVNTLVYNPTKGYKNSVAFRTGYWDSGTELIVDIGPDGRIIGAGGDGGRGGDAGSGGQRGQDGGSAMAILHPCIIRNRGYIQRGHGGGGGGNGINYTDVETYTYTVSSKKGSSTRTGTRDVPSSSPGGGGGGGAGLPIGIGAAPGTGVSGNGSAASGGQNAIQATTGPFTVPPTTSGNVRGGAGGAGGNRAGSGGNGGPPNRSAGSPGASPGDNGFAFVVWNDGTGVTLVNSGSGAVSSGDFPYLYNTIGELL